jgi:hypothetical protein
MPATFAVQGWQIDGLCNKLDRNNDRGKSLKSKRNETVEAYGAAASDRSLAYFIQQPVYYAR